MTNEPTKTSTESPLEKKLQLGVIIGAAILIGAGGGFLYGVHYGRWLSEPISIMEQKLNVDKYSDLSIVDRQLNITRYFGVPGGEYRKMER